MRFLHGRPFLVRALVVGVLGVLGVWPGVTEAARTSRAQASVVASKPIGPCNTASQATDLSIALTSGGRQRTALLHVPPAPAGRALPLVVALHGAGGNGPAFARASGLSTEGDQDGFAVVYPTSLGPQWAISSSGRDVVFVDALVDRVESMACIDQVRVSATGVSIGAGMAARIGCDLSSRFAGLVLVSGGYRSLPACDPDRPISVLEIHGTADTTVPYSGQGPNQAGAVLPYIASWATRDRCRQRPTKRVVAVHTVHYEWTHCASGASVQHLRIYGGGHGLPNALGAGISSGKASPISGVRNIWHFLASRTLALPFENTPGA